MYREDNNITIKLKGTGRDFGWINVAYNGFKR
jgi:hypothetical protein